MITLVAGYTPRIWIDDDQIHRYSAAELADDVPFLLPLCQEVSMHPTPHARIRLNDRPVRRHGSTGLIGRRVRRCPTCYSDAS